MGFSFYRQPNKLYFARMSTEKYSPIALFVYKRLTHAKKAVESLLQNKEASQSILYIFADGAKGDADSKAVAEVRDYIKNLSGFKKIIIEEHSKNKGLANSIISGVAKVINEHGRVIVVEDDLKLSPFFLQYMNEGLSVYENEPKVASIHGYTYPVEAALPETYFLRGADCWGWATWKRAWSKFEPSSQKLLQQIVDSNLETIFDFDGYAGNIKMLKNQSRGKIDSWAIRWHASTFLADMCTLYPGKSLVQNTGMDGGGTHSSATDVFSVELYNMPIKIVQKEVKVEDEVYDAIKAYHKSKRKNYFTAVMGKIKKIFF